MRTGIGILSTDRFECLSRLVVSISRYTDKKDLKSTPVFVFDDSSKQKDTIKNLCKKYPWLKFVDNGSRIGVANNTNKALDELSCFDYMLIFNNDMEVLKKGWINLYQDAMDKTGFHHFCFRQLGLWGACRAGEKGRGKVRPDVIHEYEGIKIATIKEKPQGALLALSKKAFETVGFFNTNFPIYGGSHHLYSYRIWYSGIQPEGIHDLANSNEYFKVHDVPSVTPQGERIKLYREALKRLEEELRRVRGGEGIYYEPEGI